MLYIFNTRLFKLSIANRLCPIKLTFSTAKLPDASWSVKSLNLISTRSDPQIDDSQIAHLAKMSCININSNKLAVDEVISDVSVILRCAKSLQNVDLSLFPEVLIKSGIRTEVSLNDLYDNKEVNNDSIDIFQNCKKLCRNYFVVPKVLE